MNKFIVLFFTFLVVSCGGGSSTTEDNTSGSIVSNANRFLTTITSNKLFLTADAKDVSMITVELKDSNGDRLSSGNDVVVLQTTIGTLSAVQNNNDGSYSATLTSPTEQSLAIITGTLNGEIINNFAGVAMRIDKTAASFISLAALGKKIFNDSNLSEPAGQSCASCHDAATGFDDPDDSLATSQGATDVVIFGQRNAQTVQYAAFTPQRQIINTALPKLIGGQFWDGREVTLEEQSKQPFLNPLEMNNSDKLSVINKIKSASYKADFETIFGSTILDNTDQAYEKMALAIAAFQRTYEVSPFNSKFDAVTKGSATFTTSEARGEQIFNVKAQCKECHFTPDALGEQTFSNYEYSNIGVPENPSNLFLNQEASFVDLGLGGFTNEARDNGKFKTPILRNIAKTAPYMHNGVFKTLREVIDFYNDDLVGAAIPEVNQNLERGGQYLGFGLTEAEKVHLEAFLNTLTDL